MCDSVPGISVQLMAGRSRVTLLSQCNKTIVAFSVVVLFNRGRSLVIALSPSIVRWPLKKWRHVYFVTSTAGIVFKLASLDHAPYRILYVKMNVICRQ